MNTVPVAYCEVDSTSIPAATKALAERTAPDALVSAEMLVNRERCWRELYLAAHFNEQADFTYQWLWGDKDTYPIAWKLLGTPYARMWPSSRGTPHGILHFDQHGDVRACCQNAHHPLGNVTQASLLDIWRGVGTSDLRRALEHADYSLGCEFCEWPVSEGRPEAAFARWYDDFPITADDPEWPVQLELSMLPCTSITRSVPALRWRRSTFCVTTASSSPNRSSSTSASCAAFGSTSASAANRGL